MRGFELKKIYSSNNNKNGLAALKVREYNDRKELRDLADRQNNDVYFNELFKGI